MTEIAKQSHAIQQTQGYSYQKEATRHVAMPLGGLGAGQIALCGDGTLRQWQMVNQINHLGFVPHSFFALRVMGIEPNISEIRLLQSQTTLTQKADPTPLVNDDYVPEDVKTLLQKFPGVESTVFTGNYPFATIQYEDSTLPIEVQLEAFSPFIPLDEKNSGLPAIIFTFTLKSRWSHEIVGGLGATLQNAVGWDGITPIKGNRNPLYGGNTNRVRRTKHYTALVMENPLLPDDHPGAGQMVLASLTPGTKAYERWTEPEQFMRFMDGLRPGQHLFSQEHTDVRVSRNVPIMANGASPAGETWDGGLMAPFRLAPGETRTITFILSWHFPNRYLNFDQFGAHRNYGQSKFWLGNAYATRFTDAIDVCDYTSQNLQHLENASRKWPGTLFESSLPGWIAETLAAQGTLMRSPTCFWTEDGKFYGFEGSLGASTHMWNADFGGSCPLNCTHVWNYELALSRLFPRLEQSMRETDLERVQAPEGYIPHRTVLPLYLPQFWNEAIGGPENPALDGMLGTVLKVYREVRHGAGSTWFDRLWPRVKHLMNYIVKKWDDNEDGVLEGEQPNTYDIAFYGPNMYIGALWLAALRATEEMAKYQGETDYAYRLHQIFERGSKGYDNLLWNGEYYIQLIDPDAPPADQFGDGCLADQLFGQWWAHILDLGYILPEEHVKTTLRSIVRYNFKHDFTDFQHIYRVFADRQDTGLLVCTWPRGGRPETPVRYCDEVWTGIEYHVGAHCIMEGLTDEGLAILQALRKRYDGTRRNPYNEIECGDHYARAMAGWSTLDALSGFRYNALTQTITFLPQKNQTDARMPFIVGSGWGTIKRHDSSIHLTCTYGEISIKHLLIHCPSKYQEVTLSLDNKQSSVALHYTGDDIAHITCEQEITLKQGNTLVIMLKS